MRPSGDQKKMEIRSVLSRTYEGWGWTDSGRSFLQGGGSWLGSSEDSEGKELPEFLKRDIRIKWQRYVHTSPVLETTRSKARVCGRSLRWDRRFETRRWHGRLSRVIVSVLSCRGLYDQLTTRPEETYRLWCVVECDLTFWHRSFTFKF
jgi:hypothetical protein